MVEEMRALFGGEKALFGDEARYILETTIPTYIFGTRLGCRVFSHLSSSLFSCDHYYLTLAYS
jgi:hypothetical protein